MKVVLDAPRLRDEMVRRGWDQSDLAREAGVSRATVARCLADLPIQVASYVRINRALATATAPDLVVGVRCA